MDENNNSESADLRGKTSLSLEDPIQIEKALDVLFRTGGIGSLSDSIGMSFNGLNHRGIANRLPMNKEQHGITFFTKPNMNMSTPNLLMDRRMYKLLSSESASIPRAIRVSLGPEICRKENIYSSLIDDEMIFMPILTNTLISVSGFPDLEVSTFTAKDGAYKETYQMVDGVSDIYRSYDINCEFRNIDGSPSILLFAQWLHYMSLVFQGELVPRLDSIIEQRIDYQTRIWRLVLDEKREKVAHIGCCIAAIPTGISYGAIFNYEADKPFNLSNDRLSVRFSCVGVEYDQPILIEEFNAAVSLFNENMKYVNDARKAKKISSYTDYIKIPKDQLVNFNFNGYPRINPDTMELEYWIDKRKYDALLAEYSINKQG